MVNEEVKQVLVRGVSQEQAKLKRHELSDGKRDFVVRNGSKF